MNFQSIALTTFGVLGGAALIAKLAVQYTPQAVGWAMSKVLNNPIARAFSEEHEEQVLTVLNTAVAEIKKDIDAAKQEDAAKAGK